MNNFRKQSNFNKSSPYDNLFNQKTKNMNDGDNLFDQKIKKKKDSRFGKYVLAKFKDSTKNLIKIEESLYDKNVAENNIKNLEMALDIDNKNILKLLDFSTFVQKNWCNTLYFSKAYYDYQKNDLSKEIKKRKKSHRYFNENELNNILLQICNALKYLQEKNLYHNNLRPEFITGNFLNFNFKLIYLYNNNDVEMTEINKKQLLDSKKKLYISPEVYKNINNQKQEDFNIYKTNSFSLGLILWESALLTNIQKIYKDKNIDFLILESYLIEVERKYNKDSFFCKNLRNLLKKDENERYDFLSYFYQNNKNLINNDNNIEKFKFNSYLEKKQNNFANLKNLSNANFSTQNELNNNNQINYNSEKITIYRYKIDGNGNKVLLEDPKIIENSIEEEKINKFSKIHIVEPLTEIKRSYNDVLKSEMNPSKKDILKSNLLLNKIIPRQSQTYIGQPINSNRLINLNLCNNEKTGDLEENLNQENKNLTRISKTYINNNVPVNNLPKSLANKINNNLNSPPKNNKSSYYYLNKKNNENENYDYQNNIHNSNELLDSTTLRDKNLIVNNNK